MMRIFRKNWKNKTEFCSVIHANKACTISLKYPEGIVVILQIKNLPEICRNLNRKSLGQKETPQTTKTNWLISTLFEEENQLFKYHAEKHENMKLLEIDTNTHPREYTHKLTSTLMHILR